MWRKQEKALKVADSSWDDPILTAVELTCRPRPHVAALPHVVSSVDTYLNWIDTKWTLELASRRGFVKLMDRLGKLEWPGVSHEFRKKRFLKAASQAAKDGNLPALQWWLTTYFPDHAFAIPIIQQHAIEFDYGQNGKLTVVDQRSPFRVTGDCEEMAYWLHAQISGIRMELVALSDSSIEFARWAYAHQDLYEVRGICNFMYKALRDGYYDDLPWLEKLLDRRLPVDYFEIAISNGFQLRELKWLYGRYPKHYFDDPLSGGPHLDVIKWILQEYEWNNCFLRVRWIEQCVKDAVYYEDRLKMIQALCSACPDARIHHAIELAARLGRFDIVKYLHAQQQSTLSTVCSIDAAASCGHLEILQWLYERRSDCTVNAMNFAAKNNHLNVVQWLHANSSAGCTTQAMDQALIMGHFQVVQWLHANRSEGCTPEAMDTLAASGRLGLVQWLHENRSEGCTTKAMDGAAANGHLKVVQFLHQNRAEGCTTDAMGKAADRVQLDMLQWLHENKREGCTVNALGVARGSSQFEVVKWLFENRPEVCTASELGKVMKVAAYYGDAQFVMWLLPKVSAESVQVALQTAITEGHLMVVKQLIKYCDLSDLATVLATATQWSHFAVVEWVLKHHNAVGPGAITCPFQV